MQQLNGLLVSKRISSFAMICNNALRRERRSLEKEHIGFPAYQLRPSTPCRAAQALAQGQIEVETASGLKNLQLDGDEKLQHTRPHVTAGPDKHSSSEANGHPGSNGLVASSSTRHQPPSEHHDSDGKSSAADKRQQASMSATSAKDRLKHDLDRERSLNSSSGARISDKSTVSPSTADDVPAGAFHPKEPDTASHISASDWQPRKERLKRLREHEDSPLDEKERLRRLRISQANKGRKPWNTGVKHPSGEACSDGILIHARREQIGAAQAIQCILMLHTLGKLQVDVKGWPPVDFLATR